MHAYLLVGANQTEVETQIKILSKKFNAKILDYSANKISDVRNLTHLVSLSFSEPTILALKDFNASTEEAQNALLKNLEEPQDNVYFILCASSINSVLPTIASRCQIIKLQNEQTSNEKQIELQSFLALSLADKLEIIDKVKDRNIAMEMAESLIKYLHGTLHQNEVKYVLTLKQIEIVQKTLACLKSNGNVNLHLSKMAIDLDNLKLNGK